MKYALVTGGSRGIGRAICVRLAQDGYSVIINYRGNEAAAKETQGLVEQVGGVAELLPFDVSDKQQVVDALDLWQSKHEGEHIDVLVNNAGIRDDGLLVFMKDEQWDRVIATTLNGFFFVTRHLLEKMVVARHGRIINIASVSGVNGMAGQTNYSAAKSALIGATKALALEVAQRKITVNALAPGFIRTDMTAALPEIELKKMIPMRRFGEAEEVAAAVSFLVSDGAAYITGQTITIAGGL